MNNKKYIQIKSNFDYDQKPLVVHTRYLRLYNRYEWSVGYADYYIPLGIFDLLEENVWQDAGQLKDYIFTTKTGLGLSYYEKFLLSLFIIKYLTFVLIVRR